MAVDLVRALTDAAAKAQRCPSSLLCTVQQTPRYPETMKYFFEKKSSSGIQKIDSFVFVSFMPVFIFYVKIYFTNLVSNYVGKYTTHCVMEVEMKMEMEMEPQGFQLAIRQAKNPFF